jgi:hypothetical protein
MSARVPPENRDAMNARRRAANAAIAAMRSNLRQRQAERDVQRQEQRARMNALADAVDLEQVGRNYAAAAATEDLAWRSKQQRGDVDATAADDLNDPSAPR